MDQNGFKLSEIHICECYNKSFLIRMHFYLFMGIAQSTISVSFNIKITLIFFVHRVYYSI